jgi:hypothetical protein
VILFPPGTVLFSRAYGFLADHPGAVVALGVAGVAPAAALGLMFLREAHESWLVSGAVAALAPLSFALAAAHFVRFPFALALARYMARASRGEPARVSEALAFAAVHLPTSLLLGALATLGWLLGSVVGLPLVLAQRASLAFHLFAGTELTPFRAIGEAGRLPFALFARLVGTALLLLATLFVVAWTTPGALLGLAEWLLRAEVAALREAVGPSSPAWICAAFVLSLAAVQVLWTVAFGVAAAELQRLSLGSDLSATLDFLERRPDEAFD